MIEDFCEQKFEVMKKDHVLSLYSVLDQPMVLSGAFPSSLVTYLAK